MTEIEQTAEELRQLREKQALHRRQFRGEPSESLGQKETDPAVCEPGKDGRGDDTGCRQAE